MNSPVATLPPVVAVLSPKGGTGKTTIAVNVAVALARHGGADLVDLDAHAGDLEYALRLHPIQRLDDAIRRLDSDPHFDLGGIMTPHPAGLRVLCAPSSPIDADRLSPPDLLRVVDRLVREEKPLVLDTATGIDEVTIGAFERSTHPVLVTCTDVASVQAGRKFLDTLGALDMDSTRLRLVINRATAGTGLTVADVEDVLGIEASLRVPDDRRFARAINVGTSISEFDGSSDLARPFNEFADRILGRPTDNGDGRKRWGWGT